MSVRGASHFTVMLPVVGPPTAVTVRGSDGGDAAPAPRPPIAGDTAPSIKATTATGVIQRRTPCEPLDTVKPP